MVRITDRARHDLSCLPWTKSINDQLCSYRYPAADLRLCFLHMQKAGFLMTRLILCTLVLYECEMNHFQSSGSLNKAACSRRNKVRI